MQLVTGFFFQHVDLRMGAVTWPKDKILLHTFQAIIADDYKSGSMRDQFGDSELSFIYLSQDRFQFIKEYQNGTGLKGKITFLFKKRREYDMWEGEWYGFKENGDEVRGAAKCFINPLPPDAFLPPRPVF